ncbi:phage holin family protein [Desulfonatronum thiodismutans]|uniref:phage holin family protein n=1 Tax=Desulfonatronum thiodismutans TaxID=159290 RepID=UPI00068986FE|nr:phage holin family protein [Desulfonatronum thiodismutans]
MENKNPASPRESFTELLEQLAKNFSAVVHDEIELVVQGFREQVSAACSGFFTVVVGAFIIFAALLSFCAALIIELTSYMAPVMAALLSGAALALLGAIIAFVGYRHLKKAILKP